MAFSGCAADQCVRSAPSQKPRPEAATAATTFFLTAATAATTLIMNRAAATAATILKASSEAKHMACHSCDVCPTIQLHSRRCDARPAAAAGAVGRPQLRTTFGRLSLGRRAFSAGSAFWRPGPPWPCPRTAGAGESQASTSPRAPPSASHRPVEGGPR